MELNALIDWKVKAFNQVLHSNLFIGFEVIVDVYCVSNEVGIEVLKWISAVSGGYVIGEFQFEKLGLGKMHAKGTQSSFRDRTQEFQGVAERLKKSFSSAPGPSQNGPSSGSKFQEQRSVVAIHSEFNKRASKIGYGIHQTSQKLGKLTKCELLMILMF